MLLAIFVVIVLFGSLLLVNAVQMASLIIRPFSASLFRRVNTFAANSWWGWCVSLSRMAGIKVHVTGDRLPYGENAIVIANHQSAIDIVMLMFLAFDKGRLGDLKWFVKDVLKYVPGVGWGMLFLDCLFVKRSWMQDQKSIQTTFKKFVTEKIPFWLVTFPEGTRSTASKLSQSQSYAKEKGLTQFHHVLVPRKKGFTATVHGLHADAKAVYDVTIAYPQENTPTLWEYIQGKVKKIDVHVKRYAIQELPKDEIALGEWLMQRFERKDQVIAHYNEAHVFS
ncbi:MAG: acyltransferase [Oligoflexales bacterium]|nr:acyltransferase [Oligoflexales bacterium]